MTWVLPLSLLFERSGSLLSALTLTVLVRLPVNVGEIATENSSASRLEMPTSSRPLTNGLGPRK